MKQLRNALIFLLLLTVSAPAWAKKCVYTQGATPPAVQWTAFKTSDKIAVQGSFTNMTIGFPPKKSSMPESLRGLQIAIDSQSVKTGDAARDAIIASSFFNTMADGTAIKGVVLNANGDERRGKLELQLTMNGQTQVVPMSYQIQDGVFSANGSIDVLKFGMSKNLEALANACKGMHTGSDGVAKTWSTVDISVSGPIARECQ